MENTEKKTVASWRQEEKLLIVILLLFLVLLHQLFLLVWPSICRPWFKICVNSPRGPGPTCSLLPFVHKVTKDNGKRLDPALPRGSNLPSSCCVVLLYSSLLSSPLPPPFCKTLSPPISSSLFGSFHHPTPHHRPFPLMNLSLFPHRPNVKGSFCARLMERTLSNKDAHATERRQQIGPFVSRPVETLSSWRRQDEGQEGVCDLFAAASASKKESSGRRKVRLGWGDFKGSLHCTLLSSPSFDCATVQNARMCSGTYSPFAWRRVLLKTVKFGVFTENVHLWKRAPC